MGGVSRYVLIIEKQIGLGPSRHSGCAPMTNSFQEGGGCVRTKTTVEQTEYSNTYIHACDRPNKRSLLRVPSWIRSVRMGDVYVVHGIDRFVNLRGLSPSMVT